MANIQLKEYKDKRNFKKTDEPPGKVLKRKGKDNTLIYAVQHHIARREHFDLRLEWRGALLSWAVPKGPSLNPSDKRLAIQVEPHPLEYADFEGTIPRGQYGGGTVMLWDRGSWQPLVDPDAGMEQGMLKFVIEGSRLKGKWALIKLKADKDSKDRGDNWLLLKERDIYAKQHSQIDNFNVSIISGRTMEQISGETDTVNKIEVDIKSKQNIAKGSVSDTVSRQNSKEKLSAGLNTRQYTKAARKTDKIKTLHTEKPATDTKSIQSENAAKYAERLPVSIIAAQLAKPVKSIPAEGEWLYEAKYDGYRILAYTESGNVRLLSRNNTDYTDKFADIADSVRQLAGGGAMVLDGEAVIAVNGGRTDFQALQNYVKNPNGKNLSYVVFDLPVYKGKDLRQLPLINRKKKLAKLLEKAPPNIHYSIHVEGGGNKCFDAACQQGLEGIVGKRKHSPYNGVRNGDWIKVKCIRRAEFVIGGYTLSSKKLSGVSSLLLGTYQSGKLIYSGRCGTGITQNMQQSLQRMFNKLIRKTPPFALPQPKISSNETVFWLSPALAAEVMFAGITDDNVLRHASFKGLRTDKPPKEIEMENYTYTEQDSYNKYLNKNIADSQDVNKFHYKNSARKKTAALKGNSKTKSAAPKTEDKNGSLVVSGVAISSPDKLIYSQQGITKLDVVRYYQSAARRMLKYAGGRILSIVRCPKGVSEPCFYKKHPGPGSREIRVVGIDGSSGISDYFYVDSVKGVVGEAQMGTLEFHTWGSKADDPDSPDMMVFDLDPDEGMDLSRVRQGVEHLKSVLDGLSLKSYLKLSGGKGYHVVVPVIPDVGWDKFGEFAKQIALVMERTWPHLYTSNMRKIKRRDRIFIDWVRNGRGATSIAPYSLRARPSASVSMPILWKELYSVPPDGISMQEALIRLKKPDPWKNFFSVKQSIKTHFKA